MTLRISQSKDAAGAVTVLLVGDLDLATGGLFERALQRAIDAAADAVVCDHRGVEFMDSTGLMRILRVHEHARRVGRRLVLVRPPTGSVRHVLDQRGLERYLAWAEEPPTGRRRRPDTGGASAGQARTMTRTRRAAAPPSHEAAASAASGAA